MNKITVIFAFALTLGLASKSAAQEIAFESTEGSPCDMMSKYLINHARDAWKQWQANFETIETPEQIAAYQRQMRALFLEKLGGFPERTPLNVQITGTLKRPGYRVEKILFESRPDFHVTGILFIPDSPKWSAPYPGVLVPCGHALNAKAYDTYQSMGALLALNGMVALVFDPFDQGERMQLLDDKSEYLMWGTKAHTMAGISCILLGKNSATFEIWDGMRGIDYLQSRPEVDPEYIGITGNSGGGTQTSMLMALDDRIKAAAPSCYLNHVARQLATSTGDAEQNIYGQLGLGPDHADFIMMRAPSPVLICAATEDFFDIHATWETFRFAKRRFSMMGQAEKVSILENNAGHNYNRIQRESIVRWMAKWLQQRVETITEPDIELFSEEELLCTSKGQVMLLPGERSIYDINAELEKQFAEKRVNLFSQMSTSESQAMVRAIAGISRLEELPDLQVEEEHTAEQTDDGNIYRYTFRPEAGIWLPAVLYAPTKVKGTPVFLLHEDGKKAVAEKARSLMKSGQAVLTVDLRGNGETQQTEQSKWGQQIGTDWEDYFKAYVLGRSYVGMRAEDILVCARWLAAQYRTGSVAIHATGNIGVPALHAAAMEPQLVETLHLDKTLASWQYVVHQRPTYNQLINTVHGALRSYDLPDLTALLKHKITVTRPLDAQGNQIEEK
ncbi:MAG: acetylxylan esterase [Bacteroidota bacterium]|nr:acetylxylan esterase [Bacteroidota bacterium]